MVIFIFEYSPSTILTGIFKYSSIEASSVKSLSYNFLWHSKIVSYLNICGVWILYRHFLSIVFIIFKLSSVSFIVSVVLTPTAAAFEIYASFKHFKMVSSFISGLAPSCIIT